MLSTRPLAVLAVVALTSLASGCGSATPPPLVGPVVAGPTDATTDTALQQSLAGPQRTDKERARDVYRHPRETLAFFGLRDGMTVVEISPGGGWYSAVLAPVLRDHGKLWVAGGDPSGDPKSEGTQDARALQARFDRMPQVFDRVGHVVVSSAAPVLGPPESADLVLTFRNYHNWVGDPFADRIVAASFAVLKHGGTFGLVDHRAKPGPLDAKAVGDSGYVPEDAVVDAVQKAGFRLAARSEVNANAKDTKDYPKGVWTLPPTYELGDADHAKYEAIGESDRMTLRFVKP